MASAPLQPGSARANTDLHPLVSDIETPAPRLLASAGSLAVSAARPSRRSLLAGMAVAPIAAAAAPSGGVAAADEAAFDRAYALAMKAEAESNHFERTVYDLRDAACCAAQTKLPHIRAGYVGVNGPGFLSSDNSCDVNRAAALVRAIRNVDRGPPTDENSFMRATRKIRAHSLWRARQIQRLHAKHGMHEAVERSNALGAASYDAFKAMVATPAATGRPMLIKAEAILERQEEADQDNLTVIVADIRRTLRATST